MVKWKFYFGSVSGTGLWNLLDIFIENTVIWCCDARLMPQWHKEWRIL